MNEIFRQYQAADYFECEALVNKAWGFDQLFAPQTLCDLAKALYTKGALLASNYKQVVEVDGKVVGFLFGLNEYGKKPGNHLLFGLSVLWRLMWIKNEPPNGKQALLFALKVHEKNRASILASGKSEIVLFVVSEQYQGQGLGKRLWAGFKQSCQENGVSSIVVETNRLGASSFYELLGFNHLGNFDSPLHEFATPKGQACLYQYHLQIGASN